MLLERRMTSWPLRSALLAAMLALASGGAAGAAGAAGAPRYWSPSLRVGMAQEGQQHTLTSGVDLGLAVDRVTGGAFDAGVGTSYALDAGGGSHERDRVSILSVNAHVRTSVARPRPYLEFGLGYYWIDRNPSDPALSGGAAQGDFGGYAGLGAEFEPAGPGGARIGVGLAYHLIAAELSYSGGNAEDYWTLGATLRPGGPRP